VQRRTWCKIEGKICKVQAVRELELSQYGQSATTQKGTTHPSHNPSHNAERLETKNYQTLQLLLFIIITISITIPGKVYIAGGFNGQECLNTAEYYEPTTRQWTMIVPMRNRRSGIGVIAHDGCVYAVGGFNGITRMNNGEKYNPVTNVWTNITEMYSPRSNFGVEVRLEHFRLFTC